MSFNSSSARRGQGAVRMVPTTVEESVVESKVFKFFVSWASLWADDVSFQRFFHRKTKSNISKAELLLLFDSIHTSGDCGDS